MELSSLQKEKLRLVEELGVGIEKKDQLAPVAARIVSFIILTGKVGATFEDLVESLCASKSTISTHLNHLVDLNRITYYTKPGDRKKYYYINEDAILVHIQELVDTWTAFKKLHLEIKSFKEQVNETIHDDSQKFELDFHNSYIAFLEEVIASVNNLKEKIINKPSK